MINDKIKELQTLIIQKKDSAKTLKKNIKKDEHGYFIES